MDCVCAIGSKINLVKAYPGRTNASVCNSAFEAYSWFGFTFIISGKAAGFYELVWIKLWISDSFYGKVQITYNFIKLGTIFGSTAQNTFAITNSFNIGRFDSCACPDFVTDFDIIAAARKRKQMFF